MPDIPYTLQSARRRPPQNCPFPWGDLGPHQTPGSLAQLSSHPKQYLNWFSCDQQTDTQTQTGTQTQTRTQTQTDTKTGTQTETDTQTKTDTQTQTDTQSQTGTQTKLHL